MDVLFEEILKKHIHTTDIVLTGEERLRDLGLDSMASIRLLAELEEAFEVMIPDEMLVEETFETPNKLWNVIHFTRNTL